MVNIKHIAKQSTSLTSESDLGNCAVVVEKVLFEHLPEKINSVFSINDNIVIIDTSLKR